MEAIIGILGLVTEVGKCIGGPIKRHLNYLCCFSDNIHSLRGEAQKLKDKSDELQMKVDAANNNAQVIYPEVTTWLESASQRKKTVNEIEKNVPKVQKSCLNLISRYSLSKKASETVETLREFCNSGKFDQISQDAPPAAVGSLPLGPKEKFETRKKIEEDLMEALRDGNVNKIGLCGMGGIGKTTMAERIMDRVKEEKLFDEVVKVVVSQQVKLLKIQQNIANQLGLTLDAEDLATRAYKIHTRLTGTKSTLVVLDDVWETLKLGDLGIPFNNTFGRCNVLFTSRDRDVLEAMETQKIFRIQLLSDKEAWSLFREKTGYCADREDLHFVAENVAKECKCLPVALVTVGLALRNKADRQLWEDALLQLKSSNPTDLPRVLEDVYKPLKLSFDFLGNQRARSLFLLCSMFEEDSNIDLDILTWYGMGLGLFEELRNLKEARNRILRLVEMLKDGSLLLDGSKENYVRMHDVVRDMAVYVASKEHCCGFAINLDDRFIDWASWENFYKDCSWISISNLRNITKFSVVLKFPSLRLLRLERGEELSDKFFDEIREINVLSMTSIGIESLPPTTQLLKNLKALLLFNCGIESISVAGELSKLEVLCCRHCDNITTLPMEIGRLNRLRLLEITNCEKFSTIVPGVISSLVSLEELELRCNGRKATESSGMKNVVLAELESLTRLTRLEIEINDVNKIAQEICFPPKVEKYNIKIRVKLNDSGRKTFFHKSVCLEIPREMNLGNWIQKLLRDAEHLQLEGDGANQVNFAELGNVKSLILESCSSVKKLVNTVEIGNSGAFHLLESLKLKDLKKLEEIIPAESNNYFFRNLRKLEIRYCPRLCYLFPVSMATRSNLSQLEELTVSCCEAIEDIFYNDDDEDYDDDDIVVDVDDDIMEKDGTRHSHHLRMALPKLTRLVLENIPRLAAQQILNKIVAPGLKSLKLREFKDNISSEGCSFSILNNLVRLEITCFNGIKNLMSSSVARNLLCLEELKVINCNMMLEVIADDEEQHMDKISLFPALSILWLGHLPKLRCFCQWKYNCTLEMPALKFVVISDCPRMETFTLGSLSTPKLKNIIIGPWGCTEIEDLNEAIQCYFKLKDKLPRWEISHVSPEDYKAIIKRFMETEGNRAS